MSHDAELAERIGMIRDSAAGLAPTSDLRRVRSLRFGAHPFDRTTWREMAEMGWVGLRTPEALGGAGMGLRELCALAEALGAALTPEPVIAATAIAPLLPDKDRAAQLAGERIILPAIEETDASLAPQFATRFENGALNGCKPFVPAGGGADGFLVAAAQEAVLADAQAAGVQISSRPTQDGGRLDQVVFEDTPAQAAGRLSSLVAAGEEITLGTAAYLLGLADRAFEMTLEHLRVRQQFGRAVGSFQALQHRAADLKVELELCRASIGRAATVLDTTATAEAREAAVSRARARAGDTAMLITRQAIQLHGGIGYADESDIGLYLRKAMTLLNRGGSPSLHRKRYAALSAARAA